MLFSFALAAGLLLVTPTFASLSPSLCGTNPSDDVIAAMEKHFMENKVVGTHKENGPPKTFNINVYWHVISSSDAEADGNIPQSSIDTQMKVLNQDYESSHVQWTLVTVTRTINPLWYKQINQGSPEEKAMKKALRQGGVGDLNVYTVKDVFTDNQRYGGYSTFPIDYAGDPDNDGVVMTLYKVQSWSNLLTHEAGHWVGLYHTFEGGCQDRDYVSDTPPQRWPSGGCYQPRPDTCYGGTIDAPYNFMDYPNDGCELIFTPGQSERLKQQLETYRGL